MGLSEKQQNASKVKTYSTSSDKKKKSHIPLWVKYGLRVLNADETARYIKALMSCTGVGCKKGVHIFVGYREVSRCIEDGRIACIAVMKNSPRVMQDYLLEAAFTRGMSAVMLPSDATPRLSAHLKVNKLTVVGFSRHGLPSGISLNPNMHTYRHSEHVEAQGSRKSKRLGIARAQLRPARANEGDSHDGDGKKCHIQGQDDSVSATLDGLRDLTASLMDDVSSPVFLGV
jgi:hypothetical protein